MEAIQTLLEFGISQGHCFVEVLLGNRLSNFASLTVARQIVSISRLGYRLGTRTSLTASIRGTRVILFSRTPIIYEGVSGVASSRASTASIPCRVGYHSGVQSNSLIPHQDRELTRILSNAQGRPPRCVWPSVVTLVSRPRRSLRISLT